MGIRLEDRADGSWIIKEMSADEQQEVRSLVKRTMASVECPMPSHTGLS